MKEEILCKRRIITFPIPLKKAERKFLSDAINEKKLVGVNQ